MSSWYPKANRSITYRSITSLCFAVDSSDQSVTRYCKRLFPTFPGLQGCRVLGGLPAELWLAIQCLRMVVVRDCLKRMGTAGGRHATREGCSGGGEGCIWEGEGCTLQLGLPQPVAVLPWGNTSWDCFPTERCQEDPAHLGDLSGRLNITVCSIEPLGSAGRG
jgi:hypothetical protein